MRTAHLPNTSIFYILFCEAENEIFPTFFIKLKIIDIYTTIKQYFARTEEELGTKKVENKKRIWRTTLSFFLSFNIHSS